MPARSLLVIGDNEADRQLVRRTFERMGSACDVREVCLGRDGLAAALAHVVDCILLDSRLPDIDGLELLAELRRRPEVDAPVVMLTGEGDELMAVEAMKQGAHDSLPKSQLGPDTLFRAVANAVEKYTLQRKLADVQQQLERQALFDLLTGLGNRNLFNRELNRALAVAGRSGKPFCLLVMDLDRFKTINDTLGHELGDKALAEIGRRFADMARGTDTYFRLGDDEFAAILETGIATEGGEAVARRIVAAIAQPLRLGTRTWDIGISIGMATYPANGREGPELLRAADLAMFEAKKLGLGYLSVGELMGHQ